MRAGRGVGGEIDLLLACATHDAPVTQKMANACLTVTLAGGPTPL